MNRTAGVEKEYCEECAQCAEKVGKALQGAFVWANTSQGHDYWAAVATELEKVAAELRAAP